MSSVAASDAGAGGAGLLSSCGAGGSVHEAADAADAAAPPPASQPNSASPPPAAGPPHSAPPPPSVAGSSSAHPASVPPASSAGTAADDAPPPPGEDELRAKELELENHNLTLRLSRSEKECDGLRTDLAAAEQGVARLKEAAVEEAAERERLQAQVDALSTTGGEQATLLTQRIATLEKRLKEKEKKPVKDKRDSQNLKRISCLEDELRLATEQLQQRDGGGEARGVAASLSAELKRAHAEIASLRAALMHPRDHRSQHSSPERHLSRASANTTSSLPMQQQRSSAAAAPQQQQQQQTSRQHPSSQQRHDSQPPPDEPPRPGDHVLAWWEPGNRPSPRGWANDAPGWYPAQVVALQSNTHVSVAFGEGSTPCTLPACNVRRALPRSPPSAGRLAAQLLEKNAWVEKVQASPERAAAAARHILQSEGIAVPAGQALPPPERQAGAVGAAGSRQGSQGRQASPLRGVGSRQDAERVAAQLVTHASRKSTSFPGTPSRTAYTVIGHLSASEAEEAARRIVEWELAGERSGSGVLPAGTSSPSPARSPAARHGSASPVHRQSSLGRPYY